MRLLNKLIRFNDDLTNLTPTCEKEENLKEWMLQNIVVLADLIAILKIAWKLNVEAKPIATQIYMTDLRYIVDNCIIILATNLKRSEMPQFLNLQLKEDLYRKVTDPNLLEEINNLYELREYELVEKI